MDESDKASKATRKGGTLIRPPSFDLAREEIWRNRRLKSAVYLLTAVMLAAMISFGTPRRAFLSWAAIFLAVWLLDIIVSEIVCKPALDRGQVKLALGVFAFLQGALALAASSFVLWVPINVPGGIAAVYPLQIILIIAAMTAPIHSIVLMSAWASPFAWALLGGPWLLGATYAPELTTVSITFIAYMCWLARRMRDLAASVETLHLERAALSLDLSRTQSALLDAQNHVALAKSDRREFLANLSDDMREPVNSLLGCADVMRETFAGSADERVSQQIQEIGVSAAQLQDFADDLADLSKLEAGTLAINSSRLDLPGLLASVHEALAPRLRDLQIEMGVLAASDVPFLLADEHVVRRMALNLIANAMRGTEAGGRITLAASRLPDGGLGLRVSSSGLGLSESELEHVLESFVSGNLERIGSEKPTGLSLMIVRQLAELQGGSLSLGRRVGVGSYATVHFPPERLVPKRPLIRIIEAA